MIKITTLIENSIKEESLLHSEHGLSFYIQADNLNILFDTGQTGSFVENANKLNVDLEKIDHVILSHGHYDHTGGFKRLVEEKGKSFQLITGEKFFNNKYKYDGIKYTCIGNSFDEKYVEENKISIKYINEDTFNLSNNILVVSNFEKKTDFEKTNDRFIIKVDDNYEKDELKDNFKDGFLEVNTGEIIKI
jgi:7,8-dihydropterin-6-yl-methyl-4-(beta-D-ribofuranosyl)aminobenzene 5'-phosphate synthase